MTEFHVFSAGNVADEEVTLRQITTSDTFDALLQGYRDFMKRPSHYVFAVAFLPIIGIVLYYWASGGNLFQLLFPMTTGFALLGPFAALGLYEISRRLEMDADLSFKHIFGVFKSPAIPAILAIGALLVALFTVWLFAAQVLYTVLYGNDYPDSLLSFFVDVISTSKGWIMIILGNGVGFLIALFVLYTTVIAFPLLLDRDVGARTAVATSMRAVQMNPVPMLLWGFIVAVGIFIGAVTGLVGLVVVLPILGHGTWHMYRKVVVGSRPVEA